MALGMELGLIPGDFVLHGDPAPSPKGGGAPPKFSAHFYCGETAGCIKIRCRPTWYEGLHLEAKFHRLHVFIV